MWRQHIASEHPQVIVTFQNLVTGGNAEWGGGEVQGTCRTHNLVRQKAGARGGKQPTEEATWRRAKLLPEASLPKNTVSQVSICMSSTPHPDGENKTVSFVRLRAETYEEMNFRFIPQHQRVQLKGLRNS